MEPDKRSEEDIAAIKPGHHREDRKIIKSPLLDLIAPRRGEHSVHLSSALSIQQSSPPSRRLKDRMSFSDFYKLGNVKHETSLLTNRQKDNANILKFKVRPHGNAPLTKSSPVNKQGSNRAGHGNSIGHIASATVMDGNTSAGAFASCPDSEDDQRQGRLTNIHNGSRDRAMTSPLSSVPSDFDDREEAHDTAQPIENLAGKHGVGPATYREYGTFSPTTVTNTLNVQGRKRIASQADASHSADKKSRINKKIKISSPAKLRRDTGMELGVLPQDSKAQLKTELEMRSRGRDDDQASNDGHCSACQGTGKLLCCDDCPRSFHFTCIEPPIEEADIPDEPYFCMPCWDKRYGFSRPGPGLFQQLMINEVTRDPLTFQLPQYIRQFFENVTTGELGIYQDMRDQKTLRRDRHGFAEDVDSHRLRDRQNRPILCFKCGSSALGGAGIVSCDYCTSHWHLDCVNPPLPGCPSSHKKWMCPLHATDVTPSLRRPQQSRLQNVSLARGFKNNGNVEIELSDDSHDSDSDQQSETDEEDQLNRQSALADMSKIKYTLPARGIILDFLDSCHQESEERTCAKLQNVLPITNTLDLEALVDIAVQELRFQYQPETSTWAEARVQALAMQRLMAVKGKERLIEFLTKDD